MGLDNALFSKPALARWTVERRTDDTFAVRCPDGTVYETYDTLQRAESVKAAQQKKDDAARKRMTRPCLCCSQPFESEGIHNRLCPPCRARGSEAGSYSVAPRSGRPR
jgi:hypothetical protein